MPHLIILDKNGNPIGDPNEGHRTVNELIESDHAPSGFIMQAPTLELTQDFLKAVEKFQKKDKKE